MPTPCKKCNRPVPDGRPACAYCGTRAIALVECPRCKHQVPPHQNVCQYCSNPLRAQAQKQPGAINGRDWLEKGEVLRREKRHGEAIAAYDKALAFDPGLIEAWLAKARALQELGRHDEAHRCVEAAHAMDPQHPAVQVNRRALDHLRAQKAPAPSRPPSPGDEWKRKGDEAFAAGRYDEALRCYDEATFADPTHAPAQAARIETMKKISGR